MKQMTRLLIWMILFLSLALNFGCAGKMATISETWIPDIDTAELDLNPTTISFRVAGEGEQVFTGFPTSLTFYAYSVSVDLKSIQKIAGRKVLSGIYRNVLEEPSTFEVTSSITDFRYKWSFTLATHAIVSFRLHIDGIRNGQNVFSRDFHVHDLRGKKGKAFIWGGCFGVPGDVLSGDVHKRSEMVAMATLKAVYDIYRKELPRIASMVIE